MADENLPAGGSEAMPVTQASIEDKLASFDFDHDDRREPPAGEQRQREEAPDNALDPDDLAAADEIEKDAKPEQDEHETQKVRLRDGKEVSIAELKKAWRPTWEQETKDFEEKRQKFEAESQQVQQRVQALTQHEQQISQSLEAAVLVLQNRMPKLPPKELFEQDPFEYQRQKMAHDEAKAEITDLAQKHAQLQQIGQQRAQEAFIQNVAKQHELLITAKPELRDPVKAAKFVESIKAYGVSKGFAADDFSQINDTRILLALEDAMNWRNFQASRAKLKEKEKAAAPMAPPAQAPARRASSAERDADARRDQLNRLKKTGSAKDAEAFLSRFN